MTQYQDVLKIRRQDPAILFAVFIFFLLAAMTQASADKNHGLLWEVSKAGSAPNYLFGTIHTGDPEILQLAQPVQQAFTAAPVVVLEMLMDIDAMMYSSTAMLMLDGRSLRDIVEPSLFRRLVMAADSRGVPEVVLTHMKPWAAAVTLSVPAPETGGVLDVMLYKHALQQGKRVYGLETAQEQLQVFESISEADQLVLLKDAIENFSSIDAMYTQLLTAYKRRDLGELMVLNEASLQQGDQRLAREFQQRLIVERNYRMVQRLHEYLQQGDAFVAVGALHLPGEEGLLNLLEQQGYSVRRIY